MKGAVLHNHCIHRDRHQQFLEGIITLHLVPDNILHPLYVEGLPIFLGPGNVFIFAPDFLLGCITICFSLQLFLDFSMHCAPIREQTTDICLLTAKEMMSIQVKLKTRGHITKGLDYTILFIISLPESHNLHPGAVISVIFLVKVNVPVLYLVLLCNLGVILFQFCILPDLLGEFKDIFPVLPDKGFHLLEGIDSLDFTIELQVPPDRSVDWTVICFCQVIDRESKGICNFLCCLDGKVLFTPEDSGQSAKCNSSLF